MGQIMEIARSSCRPASGAELDHADSADVDTITARTGFDAIER
jgi:hypothetical protein